MKQLTEEDIEFDLSDPAASSRKNTMTSITSSSSRSNSVSTATNTTTNSKDRAESINAQVPPPMARTTSNAREQQSRTASITSVKDRSHSEAQPPESEVNEREWI